MIFFRRYKNKAFTWLKSSLTSAENVIYADFQWFNFTLQQM